VRYGDGLEYSLSSAAKFPSIARVASNNCLEGWESGLLSDVELVWFESCSVNRCGVVDPELVRKKDANTFDEIVHLSLNDTSLDRILDMLDESIGGSKAIRLAKPNTIGVPEIKSLLRCRIKDRPVAVIYADVVFSSNDAINVDAHGLVILRVNLVEDRLNVRVIE
jgi:hypothetical protein